MLKSLPPIIKGMLSIGLYTLNTITLTIPLILISFIKLIFPFQTVIVQLDKTLISIATLWISINTWNSQAFCNIRWDIRGLEDLSLDEWYLVISNHQSWVDILALQTTLNKRIPMLKFFLKKELIWIPFLGLAWWALDFPFMKRYSKALLKEKPHLKGKDLESTKKACKKFKHTPVSVMNFVEGTRYTTSKRDKQNSNYSHLLTPKAGGIAFVLGSMGEYLHKIIDVTIIYPEKNPTFWEYISGDVQSIIIDFEVIDLTEDLTGDYFNDPEFKIHFINWVNGLWKAKDQKINALKEIN